jgi:hypothetical protein
VYVLLASSVKVPVPYLLTSPVDVAIGSWIATFPSPAKFRLNVPVMALPAATSNVRVPSSDWMREFAVRVTSPTMEFTSAAAVDKLRIAPSVPTPFPAMLKASAIEIAVPLRWIEAPLEIVVEPALVPSVEDDVTSRTPSSTTVDPL